MAKPEVEGMETHSTMPAKAEDVVDIAPLVVEMEKISLSIDDIRRFITPKATQKELFWFVGKCRSYGLDPIKDEVFFIKYGSDPGQTVVNYLVYVKRAERTGKLNGWSVNLAQDDFGQKAVLTIHRKDWDQPFVWETYRDEFDKERATWKQMPLHMLKVRAICQGFRVCFPDELAGMPYSREELQVEHQPIQAALQVPEIEETHIEPDLDPVDIAKEKTRMEAELGKESEAKSDTPTETFTRIWANARRLNCDRDAIYRWCISEFQLEKLESLKELNQSQIRTLDDRLGSEVLKAETAIAHGIGISLAELRQRAKAVYGSRFKLPLDASEAGIEKVTDDINNYLDQQSGDAPDQTAALEKISKLSVAVGRYSAEVGVDCEDILDFFASKYGDNPPLDIESKAGYEALRVELNNWLDAKADGAAGQEPQDEEDKQAENQDDLPM